MTQVRSVKASWQAWSLSNTTEAKRGLRPRPQGNPVLMSFKVHRKRR